MLFCASFAVPHLSTTFFFYGFYPNITNAICDVPDNHIGLQHSRNSWWLYRHFKWLYRHFNCMTSSAIFQTIIGNVYECHLQQFSSLDFIQTLQTPSAIFQTISCDILKTSAVTLSAIFQTIICNVYECHLQHFSLPDFILTLQTPFAILQTITCDILKNICNISDHGLQCL